MSRTKQTVADWRLVFGYTKMFDHLNAEQKAKLQEVKRRLECTDPIELVEAAIAIVNAGLSPLNPRL